MCRGRPTQAERCPAADRMGQAKREADGGDAFHVCYGMRRDVDADAAATLEALEGRRHP